MHIDLEQAEKAIAAARKEAVKLQTKMCIAVVDFRRQFAGLRPHG